MTKFEDAGEFDRRINEEAARLAEEGDAEQIVVPYMVTKPELDALVLMLRNREKAAKDGGDPRWTSHVTPMLDQAQGLQAQYETFMQQFQDEGDN